MITLFAHALEDVCGVGLFITIDERFSKTENRIITMFAMLSGAFSFTQFTLYRGHVHTCMVNKRFLFCCSLPL